MFLKSIQKIPHVEHPCVINVSNFRLVDTIIWHVRYDTRESFEKVLFFSSPFHYYFHVWENLLDSFRTYTPDAQITCSVSSGVRYTSTCVDDKDGITYTFFHSRLRFIWFHFFFFFFEVDECGRSTLCLLFVFLSNFRNIHANAMIFENAFQSIKCTVV